MMWLAMEMAVNAGSTWDIGYNMSGLQQHHITLQLQKITVCIMHVA